MRKEVGEGIPASYHGNGCLKIRRHGDFQDDVLFRQDVLCNLHGIGMGIPGTDHFDGGACEGIIIHIRVISISGVPDHRDGSASLLCKPVCHSLTADGGRECLGHICLCVLCLHSHHIHIGRTGIFIQQGIPQVSGNGIVSVYDAVVHVRKNAGDN